MTRQTLEQQRAQNAWAACANFGKEHVNIAKSLPALIMNSGLMQVMAFAHQKGASHEMVAAKLREWLSGQFPNKVKSDFPGFMQSLMNLEPHEYQAINAEAFAWLKWLRHMATARKEGN